MTSSAVEFVCNFPMVGPVFVEFRGVREWVAMHWNGDAWSVTLQLAEGVYCYRFRAADAVALNDGRRSTQKTLDGELWSVLSVTADAGPLWVQRSLPQVPTVEVCRGLSEVQTPLVVLDCLRPADLPAVFWLQVHHLFQDALLHIVLLNPEQQLAFGGEFVLEHEKAAPDYSLKFWMRFNIDPERYIPGVWTFLVKVEGGPLLRREMLCEAVV